MSSWCGFHLMSDTQPGRPGPSLAIRRAALVRARLFGLIALAIGGFYALLGLSLLLSTGKPLYLYQLILGVGFLGLGAWRFLRARNGIRRLEQDHVTSPSDEPVR